MEILSKLHSMEITLCQTTTEFVNLMKSTTLTAKLCVPPDDSANSKIIKKTMPRALILKNIFYTLLCFMQNETGIIIFMSANKITQLHPHTCNLGFIRIHMGYMCI